MGMGLETGAGRVMELMLMGLLGRGRGLFDGRVPGGALVLGGHLGWWE